MTKKSLFIIFSGLLFGALLGGLILLSSAAPKRGPIIGSKVDDFSLPGIDTQTVTLSQFRGKVIILNFWATWCVPCKDEMPLLQKVFQSSAGKLVVIGINSQESKSDVQNFVNQYQITFPIGLDASGELTRKFLVNGYPTTFLLDSSGVLRNLHIGELREDLLQGYISQLGGQQ